MKSVFLSLALAFSSAVAHAQGSGTVQFLNTTLSKVKIESVNGLQDAPVGTVIGLFWGESANNLTLSTPTLTLTAPGIFAGGTVYPITGTSPGQQVFLKIAGWWNPNGPTPAEPMLAYYYGETATISATLGPSAGPGTVIWQSPTGTSPNRMKPLVLVPEPSVTSLAGAGLALVAARRRIRKWRKSLAGERAE